MSTAASTALQTLQTELEISLAEAIQNSTIAFKELTIEILPVDLLRVAKTLRDKHSFEILIDLCGVDYLTYGKSEWDSDVSSFSRGVTRKNDGLFDFDKSSATVEYDGKRYAVVTHLLSIKNNNRLRLKVFCEDNDMPTVDSLDSIWNGVNWFEREAFDLYGILFSNHPDLRRILTDYGFVGHPFRKDFPLEGQVEMRYDEQSERVIYEPVSIESRVAVPRVIRPSEKAESKASEAKD
ncbi:MAG TPA: NADH-quinone oxidoreductase subunit C [Gammaproteobacteria bacterium]|nr:NADH-quinone oxidoreductase subunit C [Gammaproteobacteria bacterium]